MRLKKVVKGKRKVYEIFLEHKSYKMCVPILVQECSSPKQRHFIYSKQGLSISKG